MQAAHILLAMLHSLEPVSAFNPSVSREYAQAAACKQLDLLRTGIVATAETPERVKDPVYYKATGTWRCRLPVGVNTSSLPTAAPDRSDATPGGLPCLPSGAHVEIEEQFDVALGGKVWRASGALARWQISEGKKIQGAQVLELGAGTGVSGIFAAALGASKVVLTDGWDTLLPLLALNVERNRASMFDSEIPITTAHWCFGAEPPECVQKEVFDLAIGSDILYAVNTAGHALCETLHWLLSSATAKRCVLAHEHRRADMFEVDAVVRNEPAATWDENDKCLHTFLALAADHDLCVRPLVTERGYRFQRADGLVELATDLSVFEVNLRLGQK